MWRYKEISLFFSMLIQYSRFWLKYENDDKNDNGYDGGDCSWTFSEAVFRFSKLEKHGGIIAEDKIGFVVIMNLQ